MSNQTEHRLDVLTTEVYDRPGIHLSATEQRRLRDELRDFAALSLHPLPDYQCLSSAPDALDDKLIIVMRHTTDNRIAAFMSALYLIIPPSPSSIDKDDEEPLMVVHTGLTCVSPALRRVGMTQPLVLRLAAHLRAQPAFARGVWMTSLAEVPSSLGSISLYLSRVYPAPGAAGPPSAAHLRIADAFSARFRKRMHVAPEAVFDRARFVFRGANPLGSCFRKDAADGRWRHREERVNAFYEALLGRNEGNAVLQVGYVDWDRALKVLETKSGQRQMRKRLQKARL